MDEVADSTSAKMIRFDRVIWGIAVGIGLFGMLAAHPLFVALTDGTRSADIMWHIDDLLASLKGQGNVAYSYWFYLLYAVSGFSTDREVLRFVACWLLALLIGLKASISYLVLAWASQMRWIPALVVGFLLIHMPVNLWPKAWLAQGKSVANYWHNSTLILLMPFAILLFFAIIWYFRLAQVRIWAHLAVASLVVLTLGAKPSYVVALFPALGIYGGWLVWQQWRSAGLAGVRELVRDYWLRVVVLFGSAIPVLAVQFFATFVMGGTQGVGIGFGPFATLRAFAGSWPLGMAESLVLPVLVTWLVWKVTADRLPLILAWATWGVAFLQFALIVEVSPKGKLIFHGNWEWGLVAATYVLHLVLGMLALRHWRTIWISRWRFVLLALVLAETYYGIKYQRQLWFSKKAYR